MRFATLNLRGGGENNDAYVGDGSSESSSSKSVETSTENSGFATNRSTSSFSLAKEETRVVFRIKILVLIVIGVAALTCGIWTYVFVTSSEHELFRQKVRCDDSNEEYFCNPVSNNRWNSFWIMPQRFQPSRTRKQPTW